MPHDAKGNVLKPGDRVITPFTVKQVHLGEDFCNLDVETVATMPPEHRFKTSLGALNTKMVIRANPGDDTTFSVMTAGSEGWQLCIPTKDDDHEG